ncbi:MAG: hypothetical protein K9J32_07515 [Synechococcus lacustris]|nr:hypothetical protein [Synechococcus lacustris]
MSKLVTLNGSNDQELLSSIFDNEIVVFEDIQGSKIWINWDGKEFTIKPKSIGSESINLIDLAMQNYYNPAIKFFESLDIRVKSLLNRKWWFCFEYFPDNQPANIEYSRVPKNNLVLTALNKSGKYDFSIEELDEYARLFDVDMLPIVFQGKLNERMIEAIKYFINTSEDDLEYIFGEKSFAFFFYKILNPSSQNSFLMEDEDYQSNLEKLIVRTKKGDLSFEILNPLYKRISDNNSTDFVEIYTLILVNFLNFCQSFNLDEIKLKGSKRDEIYIYLISKLFNVYISEVKQDLLDFDFTVPEFFDKEKFKINTELISNKLTKEYIKESDKLEYIFKVILGSFSKKRKKPIGVFTDNTVILFNVFVTDVSNYIEKYMNKIHEVELTRAGLLDFGDFFEIQYDSDGEGEVYPDVYSEFEKGAGGEKKKKGKGGKLPVTGGEEGKEPTK